MKKNVRVTLIAVVCVVVVVGLYFYTTNQKRASVEDMMALTKVQEITTKNLDKNYPATPREVIKFYNQILTCYYNEKYTEDELYALGDQARKLLDDELLENNDRNTYFASLKAEIKNYQERSKTIVNTNVCKSNEIDYQTVDGDECAYVKASYFTSENKNFSHTDQMYVLRKDKDGAWKILVFYQVEGDSSDGE